MTSSLVCVEEEEDEKKKENKRERLEKKISLE